MEWTDYDEEMQRLGQEIAKDKLEAADAKKVSDDDAVTSKDEL